MPILAFRVGDKVSLFPRCVCQARRPVSFQSSSSSSSCLAFYLPRYTGVAVGLCFLGIMIQDGRLCSKSLHLTLSHLSSLLVNLFSVLSFHCPICSLPDLLRVLCFIWYERVLVWGLVFERVVCVCGILEEAVMWSALSLPTLFL